MTRRVLVVAEAVTLAHVGRALTLAKMLEQQGYLVVVAYASHARKWLQSDERPFERIESQSPETFARSLAQGRPLYSAALLRRYVEDDLALMGRVCPDVVIGDFRLSLHISSKLAGVAYGAVANAYWSPRHFAAAHAPDLPFLRRIPRRLADWVFRQVQPMAFAVHALPFANACRSFGVSPPADGLCGIYTSSDSTGFADIAELYENAGSTAGASLYLGPLAWSPRVSTPVLQDVGKKRPLVYASIGSSGTTDTADRVVAALAHEDIDVVVTTAGARPGTSASNAIVLAFADGEALCSKASLVIGNGGSPIAYQALSAGVPLLGLTGNLDQVLNMAIVERCGAGESLAAGRASCEAIRKMARRLLLDSPAQRAAKRAQAAIVAYDVPARVGSWVAALATRGPLRRPSDRRD